MTLFKKILIANRGEIACRIARTCRRLGIATVAVYSDADASALHVKRADEAVRIGPPPVRDSYLQGEAILEAARQTGAEAIHPGYGFLSEKAGFAQAVREAGLVFIGPPAAAIDALGDKMKARQVALGAGVSPVPGLDAPLPVDGPDAIAEATRQAERIGFPLLVKAVGGGGGIGMQIVPAAAMLERAMKTCADRGRAAFGDPRVYFERYVSAPRHIEVQIFCDAVGGAVALGERECSLQRRYQKIVEESPSPALFFTGEEGGERRRRLFDAALRIVRHVGYVGAGTCEFIADESGALFFLEVNARLQVEHPVTEMCTGLDLVELQIAIAAGGRLPEALGSAPPRGHAIEARIYAEDPGKNFVPQPGHLAKVAWPEEGSELRVETGIEQGGEVTPYYDPMLAKIVAWGVDRAAAVARLDRALSETTIDLVGPKGALRTNLDFLRQVLASDAFTSGSYDTHLAEALVKRPVA